MRPGTQNLFWLTKCSDFDLAHRQLKMVVREQQFSTGAVNLANGILKINTVRKQKFFVKINCGKKCNGRAFLFCIIVYLNF